MSKPSGFRGIVFLLPAVLVIILACTLTSPRPPNSVPPTFDATKAVLELQSTALAQQLTQAASNTNLEPSPVSPVPTIPTVESQPTLTAVPPAEPAQQRFFTEDFNADVMGWTTFLTSGKETQLKQYVDDGFWIFDLGGRDMWVYSMYQPETYADVRIDVRAQNRGDNTNNISIVCRYDEAEGWYEFNMYNSGLYDIFYGRWKVRGLQASYLLIADGGSTAIHQGKEVNDYSVICKDDTLSLFINGNEVQTISQKMYVLHEGQVGVGVSSFDRLPVRVDFDSVQISEP